MAIIPSPPSTSDAASSSSSSLLSAFPPLHDPAINLDDPNAVALLQSTKERRRERNRLAAQKHRLRRSQRMTQLEQQVLALQQEKHALLTRLGVAPNPSSGPVTVPLANAPPLSATTPLSPASSYGPSAALGYHHPAPPSSATDDDDDHDHDPDLDEDEEDGSVSNNIDPRYSRSRSARPSIDHLHGHGQVFQHQHQRKRSRTGQPVAGQTQLQFVPLPLQIPHAHGHTSSQSSNSHSPPSSTHTPDPSSGSGSGPNSVSSSNKAHSASSSTSATHALQERIVELERWTEDLNGSLQDALDSQTRMQTEMKAQQSKFEEMMRLYAEESEILRRQVKQLRGHNAVGVEEAHGSSINRPTAGPTTLPPVSAVTSGLAPLSPPAENSRYGRILSPPRSAAGYARDEDRHHQLYTERERESRPMPRPMHDERESSYYERDVDMYEREPARSVKPKPRLGRVWELDHPEEPPHSTTSYARHSHGPAPMRWSPQTKTARPENDRGIRLA